MKNAILNKQIIKKITAFCLSLICCLYSIRVISNTGYNVNAITTDQQTFIENLGSAAQKSYSKYRILPSMTVAQAILESSWGKSSLSKLYYNFFGMKAGSNYSGETVTLKTGEEINGVKITVNGTFRVYHSFDEGIEGYYQFITGYSRYSNLINETNYKTACQKIKDDGWATDSSYTTKLINLIETYNLTRFDNPSNFPGEEEEGWNVPNNYTANNKLSTYDSNGNVESGRYISSGDNCYIDKVYKNGFVHVKYPTSNGDRWAYAKRDGFSISKLYLPGKSYIHCSAGTHYTPTVLWWEEAERATSYDVKIWAGKIWEVNAYKILWGQTNYECWLDLPAGYYEAYVDSRNSDGINMSANVVSFTVEKGEPVNLGDDFYAYIINTESWLHLTNDSFNTSFRKLTGESNQIWKFERQSDNSYKIINCKDKNVLDVHDFGTTDGTNVAVCGSNDSTAQRWFIYGRSGQYYLKAKCGNLVLDVSGGSSEEGTNAQMWTQNYSIAQKFSIWKLNKPSQSALSVTAETNCEDTQFKWTETEDTTFYRVAIYKNKIWESDPVKIYDTTQTEWNTVLPEGTYQLYISSHNNYSYTMSNVVTITVEDGKGDLNKDKSVMISDVIKLQQYLSNSTALTEEQFMAADMNSDGIVNVFDAIMIRRKVYSNLI